MPTADPVQFKGIPRVVKAYEMNEEPNWSLWCGKNFLTKYTGDDIVQGAETLRVFLENLAQDGSEATYTLRVYGTIKGGNITSNTPYDGSFAFKIFDDGMQAIGSAGRHTIFQMIGALQEKIEALTLKMSGEEEDLEDQEDQEPGIIGAVSKLLDSPHVQAAIGQKLVSFLDKIFPGLAPAAEAAKIGSTPDSVQVEKINRALTVLVQLDPQLGDHLEKLAAIASQDPGQYSSLITMLNKF